ncbi:MULTISPECIES: ATP-dependent DNA ligase [Subtercola]|uniref:ATP-dependent DNA ligase n=1 Tax=Subtercola vilae TaxID=2056433 RepID=A0A4T2C880_9MICO|nr:MULTISPECIES: ATP-dependent DNA ligase [Subtercola]MEA9983806.1 ATP-dependent DNA ligase [Subtercola sp. RTI3]TIH40653.1 ATP-dependent DNA ligase [Subtercola vilae]
MTTGADVQLATLVYGNDNTVTAFDARALLHLQVVIGAKLRRKESFFLSWTQRDVPGRPSTSLWLDCAIPLQFDYPHGRPDPINRAWIDALTRSANGGGGLFLVEEPTSDFARSA